MLRAHSGDVHVAAFSADGTKVMTAGDDGHVIVSSTSGDVIGDFALGSRLWSASFDNTGNVVIAGSQSGSATIIDLASRRTIALEAQSGDVFTVAFSPDGQWALTGSAGGTARLWDVATGDDLNSLVAGSAIGGAEFDADGTRVVALGEDGVATIWAL